MKLQGRNLSVDTAGADVAVLHEELQALGLDVGRDELMARRFGPMTAQAVGDFQRHSELPITGVVDALVAAALGRARELGNGVPTTFSVGGQIRAVDGQSTGSLLVRAYDRDLRSEQLLGDATTDERGGYRIAYTAVQFRRADKRSADLLLRVFAADGTSPLGESAVMFNAPRDARIDVEAEVRGDRAAMISEYDRQLASLRPALDGVTLAQLTEEDIEFLAGETRIPRESIELMQLAAVAERDTAIASEAFYGWLRQGVSLPVDALIERDNAALVDALRNAVDNGLVPQWLGAITADIASRLDALRLDRGLLAVRELAGVVREADTHRPLPGLTVRAHHGGEGDDRTEFGYAITDEQGSFRFPYVAPRATNGATRGDGAPRTLHLRVLSSPDGASGPLVETDTDLDGRDDSLVLEVPADRIPDLPDHAIAEIANRAGLEIPPALASFLHERGLRSVADIRRAGGLRRLDGVPDADAAAVAALDAHASLSVLSADIVETDALVGRGFDSIAAVARVPRARFVRDTHDTLGDYRAGELHTVARAQYDVLSNVLTGLRADAANGYPVARKGDMGDLLTPHKPEAQPMFPRTCSCADCEAAVSPMAYLADLIDYATEYLVNGSNAVTIPWLQNTFRQPLGELPTECEQMETKVRQVRICVEVLRRHLGLTADADGEAAYRLAAYQVLLAQAGTSYEEIRLAQGAILEERTRLAERLGVELDGPAPDPLQRLWLDPELVSEQSLEALFGLQDTRREPFAEGAKIGDDHNQLRVWSFDEVEWKQHTDIDGTIYVSIVRESATKYVVELYRDAARQQLVAGGTRTSGHGKIRLTQRNSSGLYGDVRLSYSQDTDQIAVVAIPHLLGWRLHGLTRRWYEQDWRADRYREGASDRLPIVDPDLIGPDDFRRPTTGDAPFDVWLNRRQWIDDRIAALGALSDLVAMFAHMQQQVTYQTVANSAVTHTAWAGPTTPGDFPALYASVLQGDDAAAAQIAADLRLSVKAFTRLSEIRAIEQLAQTSPSAPEVTAEERREAIDILVAAQKRAFLVDWIAEEDQAGVLMGPAAFWPSLRDARPGEWPPRKDPGTPWIDPDLVTQTQLPEETIGTEARALWLARRDELAQTAETIASAGAGGAFVAMIEHAVGDPAAGDPLPPAVADLEALYEDAISLDGEVAAGAASSIETHLHMSVDAFVTLMQVKAKADESDPALHPGAEETSEAVDILTAGYKRKRLYATWLAQESQAGLDGEYWRARKAALPAWRADATDRVLWRQALATRSEPPIVDPDRMIWADFRTTLNGDPAYALWLARKTWLDAELAPIESAAKTAQGLDDTIETTVGVAASRLDELADREDHGADITPELSQLTLTLKAYRRLLRLRRLVADQQPVLDSEWTDVHAILLQVRKRRQFAHWQRAEIDAGLALSPEWFVIAEGGEDVSLPAWRADWRQRRDWTDRLQSRIDQQRSAAQAVADAVSETEEATLASLRDALIAALLGGGPTVAGKARWVTDNLLIDGAMGTCQWTTRVSQAIETMQNLLSSAKSNLLLDTHPTLRLEDEDFFARWQWLGSYASWRAAMFVFLYPENILHPSFRAPSTQTPAFRDLTRELRGDRALSPETACALADDYAAYYRDVCHLEVEASCNATTHLKSAPCDGPQTGDDGMRELFYMFARSTVTGTPYFCRYDHSGADGFAQSFWQPIEALGETRLSHMIAAVPYERTPHDRAIYLFFRLSDKSDVVGLLKYDTNEQQWIDDVIELELPAEGNRLMKVSAVQRGWVEDPPTLVIRRSSKFKNGVPSDFVRSLNADGTAWEGDEPDEDSGSEDPGDAADDEWSQFRPDSAIGDDDLVSVVEMVVDYGGQTGKHRRLFFVHGHSVSTYDAESLEHATGWKLSPGVQAAAGTFLGAQARGNRVSNHLGIVVWNTAYGAPVPYALVWLDVTSGTLNVKVHGHTQVTRGVVPHHGPINGDDGESHRVYLLGQQGSVPGGAYRISFSSLFQQVDEISRSRIGPFVEDDGSGTDSTFTFTITDRMSALQLQQKRDAIETAFTQNTQVLAASAANLTYLEEAYYFVPLSIALKLQHRGFYEEALSWFRTLYDYSAQSAASRKIYYGLRAEELTSLKGAYQRDEEWLLDPLNPHFVASSRRNAYTRFTLLSIVHCFLDYAGTEFTRDTAESVAHARTLYLAALDLLDSDHLLQTPNWCTNLVGTLEIEVGEGVSAWVLTPLVKELQMLAADGDIFEMAVEQVKATLNSDASDAARFSGARDIIASAREKLPPVRDIAELAAEESAAVASTMPVLLARPAIATMTMRAGRAASRDFERAMVTTTGRSAAAARESTLPWLRKVEEAAPSGVFDSVKKAPALTTRPKLFKFCIPRNPMLEALRLRAEANLVKIRSCRNFAGMLRELEPYAAATDTVTGLPTLGAGGALAIPTPARLTPTPYRYSALIERAKHLVALAQQVESAFLAAIEKGDAERYSVLKARQDVALANAGTRLQMLRVREARDGVGLATLQRAKAAIERDQYDRWLDGGVSEWERASLAMMVASIGLDIAGMAAASAMLQAPQALAFASSSVRTLGSIFQKLAEYERRAQRWALSKALAEQDVLIGTQQIRLANDHLRVVGQEQAIAELQAEHAKQGLDFLSNKFTNAELYDWMADILEGIYRFFLQQATSVAQLASTQLGFERQQLSPPFVQADYWESPDDGGSLDSLDGEAPDRRGMTGSMRLLRDIHQLDQYAFETNQRKLQMTKTISLAQFAPVEFQQFRETGVLMFDTPMELFDRDFPGHYLRLIRSARTSVIALIPPTDGIHATLSSTGFSRVVIGDGTLFQTTTLRTPPQSVALTSAMNATGVFDLQDAHAQALLAPFEGLGVESSWELRMPKAANLFDFRTIADVLFTIEYTALDSYLFRQKVQQELDRSWRGQRAYRFRHEFADQWFDLHNPEQSATPMTVQFRTTADDFPANVDALRIGHVALYLATRVGDDVELPEVSLQFEADPSVGGMGGAATPVDGLVTTRKGMGASWLSMLGSTPAGTWTLTLPNTARVRALFEEERVTDMLFALTIAGHTPEWPS
jgi:hypothetical protein